MRPDYDAHVMILVAFASPEHFARLREEISGIVRSFRARCATSK
jgi:hypothetical protein